MAIFFSKSQFQNCSLNDILKRKSLQNKKIGMYIKMHMLKKQQLQIILSWTAVILWMFFIFILSAQHATESTHLSDRAAEIIMEKINTVIQLDIQTSTSTNFVKSFKHILRKSAHVGEYFILGALVMNAMKTSKVPKFKAFIMSAILCILYAVSDEVHQFFVPGRGAQVTDVLIDSIGAISGIGLRSLIKRRNLTSYVE